MGRAAFSEWARLSHLQMSVDPTGSSRNPHGEAGSALADKATQAQRTQPAATCRSQLLNCGSAAGCTPEGVRRGGPAVGVGARGPRRLTPTAEGAACSPGLQPPGTRLACCSSRVLIPGDGPRSGPGRGPCNHKSRDHLWSVAKGVLGGGALSLPCHLLTKARHSPPVVSDLEMESACGSGASVDGSV